MKQFKFILATILASLLFGALRAPALAADDLIVNFETSPLFRVEDGLYLPGYSKTKQAEVYHTGADSQQILVEVDSHTDLENLGSVFDFEVKDTGGAYYFIGSLKEFLDFGSLPLAVQVQNEHKTYLFTATLPTAVGNDWQGKTLQFNLSVFIEGKAPPSGPGSDGIHLYCESSGQCVPHPGEGDDDRDCQFIGGSCTFVGEGGPSYSPATAGTPPSGPSGFVAGAAAVLGVGGTSPAVAEEKPKEEVKGAATEEPAVQGAAEEKGECCCLWWVFILLQALVSLLVVYQGRKKKLAVFPAVLVNAAFGLLAYILYRLLCPTLAKALGCFWPSLLLMPLCKWFLLLDLLVFGLTAILLAGSFSKKKEMSPSA